MGKRIRIKVETIEMVAELNASRTAVAIWEALPVTGSVNLWGDEIYFSIPLSLELEDGKDAVNIGDLGYWPQGHAFCIFFGLTPLSQGDIIRPASAVSIFGKVTGDTKILKGVSPGAEINITRDIQD